MKEFEISEKVYNEILNSKIVIFVLLGYIDSKGNVCNKKLIDLLPTYKRKELTEYYEININELANENEVIFTCDDKDPVYCMFKSKFMKSEKGYTRSIKYVMPKKEWEKSLEKEKEVFFKNKEKFFERVEDNKHNSTDLSYINFENSDKLISSHVEIMNDVFLIELPKNIKKHTLKDNLKTIKYLINKNDIYYVNDIKIKCFTKKNCIVGKILKKITFKKNIAFKSNHLIFFPISSLYSGTRYLFLNLKNSIQKEQNNLTSVDFFCDKEVIDKVLCQKNINIKYNSKLITLIPKIQNICFTSASKSYYYKLQNVQFLNNYIRLNLEKTTAADFLNKTDFIVFKLIKMSDCYTAQLQTSDNKFKTDKNSKSEVNNYKTNIKSKHNKTSKRKTAIENNCSVKYVGDVLFIRCKAPSFFHAIKNGEITELNLIKYKHNLISSRYLENVKTVISYPELEAIHCKSTLRDGLVHFQLHNDDIEKKPILIKQYNYSYDYFAFFNSKETKEKLQLIKSSNNHATKHHNVIENEIQMVYFDKKFEKYSTIKIIAFYCRNCGMYFCYYEQFLAELKRLGLTLNDFLGKFYDENNTNLTLQVNSLNVKSILTKYGYSVSKQKGLSSAKRYQILSFIIDKNIMTKAHVISHIQYLIHYNGKKNSNKDAVVKWKEDIENITFK